MPRQAKHPDLPTQPYLITIQNNPAFTGKIDAANRLPEDLTIETSGYFLVADHDDADGDRVAHSASMWRTSDRRIASMIADLPDRKGELIAEGIRHEMARKEIIAKAAASDFVDFMAKHFTDDNNDDPEE